MKNDFHDHKHHKARVQVTTNKMMTPIIIFFPTAKQLLS